MSDIDTAPRSRRAILAAAVGGVAGAFAAALGRPAPAAATDNAALLLGQVNQTSTKNTGIKSTADMGLAVETTGLTAVWAHSPGFGLYAETYGQTAPSVQAVNLNQTGPSPALNATSFGTSGVGAEVMQARNGTGLIGQSTNDHHHLPDHPAKTGVYGLADYDNQSRGVLGRSTAGTGVRGEATTGTGVSAVSGTGTALAVSGRATFSRSGRATVAANKSYVDVVVPGGLAPTTLVVATLETYRTGVWVAAARKNVPAAGTVRIQLNKVASTTATTTVGWVAIN